MTPVLTFLGFICAAALGVWAVWLVVTATTKPRPRPVRPPVTQTTKLESVLAAQREARESCMAAWFQSHMNFHYNSALKVSAHSVYSLEGGIEEQVRYSVDSVRGLPDSVTDDFIQAYRSYLRGGLPLVEFVSTYRKYLLSCAREVEQVLEPLARHGDLVALEEWKELRGNRVETSVESAVKRLRLDEIARITECRKRLNWTYERHPRLVNDSWLDELSRILYYHEHENRIAFGYDTHDLI